MPSASYYAKHKERLRSENASYREGYSDRRKELNSRNYKGEKEAGINRAKTWREENPAKSEAYSKANSENQYKKNPGAYKDRSRLRQSKIRTANELEPGQWEEMVERCGNVCIVPGCTTSPVTKDHVIPLSGGGRHHISNLQPLCSFHNDSKGTRVADYREQNGRPAEQGQAVDGGLHLPCSCCGGRLHYLSPAPGRG